MRKDMFTASTVTKVTGLTYRQLDHLLRGGLLSASGGGGRGRGDPRFFTARDLVALRLARDILVAALPLAPFASALRFVQRGRELESLGLTAKLWTDGEAVVVLSEDQTTTSPRLRRAISLVLDVGVAVNLVRRELEALNNKKMKS